MAFGKAFYGQPGALNAAMFIDGLGRIIRACRFEAAIAPQKW